MGGLNGGDVVDTHLAPRSAPTARHRHATHWRAANSAPSQSQSENLGQAEEGHAVDKEVILAEPGTDVEGGGGVCDDLQDVVACHGPAKLEQLRPADGEVDLLPIGKEETLA